MDMYRDMNIEMYLDVNIGIDMNMDSDSHRDIGQG
jgi:hypothetical protein